MLHRQDEEGLIVISQPAHAWVSGQLARHWKSETFDPVREEVCLAAEQHDIGFLPWEQSPTLNPDTGLPHSFLNLPRKLHLEIWTHGIRQMLRYGRYPALLVSLHFAQLAQRESASEQDNESELTRRFVAEQEALHRMLRTSLRNDSHYGPHSTDELIRRHQQFLSLWDWLSLLLCFGLKEEKRVGDVPSPTGPSSITLLPLDKAGGRLRVTPWPFQTANVRLILEGRRLLQTFTDEEQLRSALNAAAPVTLTIELLR